MYRFTSRLRVAGFGERLRHRRRHQHRDHHLLGFGPSPGKLKSRVFFILRGTSNSSATCAPLLSAVAYGLGDGPQLFVTPTVTVFSSARKPCSTWNAGHGDLFVVGERDGERIAERTHVARAGAEAGDVADDQPDGAADRGVRPARDELRAVLDTELIHERPADQHVRKYAGRAADVVEAAALVGERLDRRDEQRHDAAGTQPAITALTAMFHGVA